MTAPIPLPHDMTEHTQAMGRRLILAQRIAAQGDEAGRVSTEDARVLARALADIEVRATYLYMELRERLEDA